MLILRHFSFLPNFLFPPFQAYLEKIAEEFEVDWKPKELRPEEMIAPVAPPTGESVPIAQGSGLGSAVSYAAVTGLSSRAVTAPYAPSSEKNFNSSHIPTVTAQPFVPPMEQDEEVDIYVPAAPVKPPSASYKNNNDDDDDDDEANNGGGANHQYDDLASRFAKLKR